MKKLVVAVLLLRVIAHLALSSDNYHLVKKIPIPALEAGLADCR